MLKSGTVAVVGTEALLSLGRYHFTKAFLGVNGVAASQGFTTPDPEEVAGKAMAARPCSWSSQTSASAASRRSK